MNSSKNQKIIDTDRVICDLTKLTTAIFILTVQMFFEWTLHLLDRSQNNKQI
jgi:hypothetical protein